MSLCRWVCRTFQFTNKKEKGGTGRKTEGQEVEGRKQSPVRFQEERWTGGIGRDTKRSPEPSTKEIS